MGKKRRNSDLLTGAVGQNTPQWGRHRPAPAHPRAFPRAARTRYSAHPPSQAVSRLQTTKQKTPPLSLPSIMTATLSLIFLFSPPSPSPPPQIPKMPSSPSSSPSSATAEPAPAAASSPPSAGDPPLSSSPIPVAIALPTIATASPTLALPAPNPNLNNSPNSSAARRGLPPPCWTNEETLALIDSYREKWYSLRRGNLRAAHWDEVAGSVAARSLHLPSSTPKTSVQCRHKIEKLRKRYRSERQRSLNHDPTAPPQSPWIFFKKMDQMENPNPNPNPHPNLPPHQNHHYRRYQEESDDDDDDDEIEPPFHRRPQLVANGGGSGGGTLKFTIPRAVRTSRAAPIGNPNPTASYNPSPNTSFSKGFVKPGLDEMRRRLEAKRRREEEEEEEKGPSMMGEMVRALRMLGDGYRRMEQMKMEMAREMERARMEMELKRTEMILDMQRRIVDSFVKGVIGEKRVKRSPDS